MYKIFKICFNAIVSNIFIRNIATLLSIPLKYNNNIPKCIFKYFPNFLFKFLFKFFPCLKFVKKYCVKGINTVFTVSILKICIVKNIIQNQKYNNSFKNIHSQKTLY